MCAISEEGETVLKRLNEQENHSISLSYLRSSINFSQKQIFVFSNFLSIWSNSQSSTPWPRNNVE